LRAVAEVFPFAWNEPDTCSEETHATRTTRIGGVEKGRGERI